eukprot:COSAG01_NODE_47397_length_390_cov_3.542955_1_plen_25_part_10
MTSPCVGAILKNASPGKPTRALLWA